MPPGHTEQATPVGAPISTPAEPCTISSPLRVMSPCRAAGFPLMVYSSSSEFIYIQRINYSIEIEYQ
ncbi:hypothetical protein FJK76_04780 [Escherichia coli]|nr:hypothetical protein [Escherichia coli]EFA4926431.1 hypothetical protein [Escherichia coli]EFA5253128.1 hypothetical protein [Escherichia coli]EFB9300216.1 hypothetical protein [Escherichia coli]EFC1548597.1 hypothetical protein [Escherichia coli]